MASTDDMELPLVGVIDIIGTYFMNIKQMHATIDTVS